MAKQMIPVYVVTGFLEAGKTTMVQGFLSDSEFNDGCKFSCWSAKRGKRNTSHQILGAECAPDAD